MKRLYIFSFENTLVQTFSGKVAVSAENDWFPLPNVYPTLVALKKMECLLGIYFNFGGVSHGIFDVGDSCHIVSSFLHRFPVDIVRVSYYSETGKKCAWFPHVERSDMIDDILRNLDVKKEEAICIGSSRLDKMAAETVGVSFGWTPDFFSWQPAVLEWDHYGVHIKRSAIQAWMAQFVGTSKNG